MKHTDEETLVMLALGECSDTSASPHLRGCAACRRELDTLRDVVAAVRTTVPEAELLTPPGTVWEAVTTELRLPRPTQPLNGDVAPISATERPSEQQPGNHRRARSFAVILAACAALLGAASGSAMTWWVTRPVVTQAEGSPTEGNRLQTLRAGSAGYARMEDHSGRRTLDITVRGLPESSGYFEVWLMDATHTKLVSMGVLGPDGRATLPVPDNIDLNEYSVVDISLQAFNGKPDHSGNSLVRGSYAL
ncbi:anti-sigma factor [Streptomyces sp. NPDC093089]|uniref:anti-sigma factor n=1 Tax=Streptomyces sp. NPDC093089 TaxID=3366024 RepID=UPI00381D051A